MDIHANSHVFIVNLCTFVTGFVQELLNTSQCGEEEIWELYSACIQQLFKDLCHVPPQGTNEFSDPNKVHHCATYLWSLIESHQIMRAYQDSCFRNHPSIVPVITLHLFQTRLTKNVFEEKIKCLDGRINALEKPRNPKKDDKKEDKK